MDDLQSSSSSTSTHFPIRRCSIPCPDPAGPLASDASLMSGITVKEETVDFDPSSPDPLLLLAAQMPLPSRRRAYTRSGRSTAESSVCEVCQGELNRFDTLLQHKLLHFNTTHVCYVCDTYFVSVENLLLHMSGVHRDILGVYPKGDAFVCPICIQRFSSSKSLLRHQNLHARKEDFSCTICALDLLGCRALLAHLSSAHHKDMKVKIQSLFICIDCRSVFTNRDSYAFHMMMRAQNESCDSPHHDSPHQHHHHQQQQFNPDTKHLHLQVPDPTPTTHHPHSSSHHQHHQQQQRSNGNFPSRSSHQRTASEDGLPPPRTGTFISPLNLSLAQRGPFVSSDDRGLVRRERYHQTSPPGVPQRPDHGDTDARMIRNGSGSTEEFPGVIHQTLTGSEGQSAAELMSSDYQRVMSRWGFEANPLEEIANGESVTPSLQPKSVHKRSKSAQVTEDPTTDTSGAQSKRFRSSESAPPEVMKYGQTIDVEGCRSNAPPVPGERGKRATDTRKNGDEEDEEEEEGGQVEDELEEHFRVSRSLSKSPLGGGPRYVGDGKQEEAERGGGSSANNLEKYRGRDGEVGGGGVGGEEDGGDVESFPFDLCRDSFGYRGVRSHHHHHHQFHHPQQPRKEKPPIVGPSSANGWQSDEPKPHFQKPGHFSISGRLMPSSSAMPRDAKNAGHSGGGVGAVADHASAEDILAFVGANRDSLMMCRHCDIIYTDQIVYYLHMGLHNLNNPWQCNLCGKVCTNAQQFSSHVIHY